MSFTIYNLLNNGAFEQAADLLIKQPLGRDDLKDLCPLGEAYSYVDPNRGNDFLSAWQLAFDHPTAREGSREAMAQLVGGLNFGPSRKITNILRRKFPESRLSKWDPKVLKNIRKALSKPKFKMEPPPYNFYVELVKAGVDETSLPAYFSHGRTIFLSGGPNEAPPSFMEVMDHLGVGGYLVYRMNELPDNYLVFDQIWLMSRAAGDLHALLARGVDDGSLTEIFSVDENLPRANGSSPHHQEPPVQFHPALEGFDIFAWMNTHFDRWDQDPPKGESLEDFREFLQRNPTLQQFVEDYKLFVTKADLKYLFKVLSSIQGSFEGGSFQVPEGTVQHLKNLMVGWMTQIRLRPEVLQEYLRFARGEDPQAVLVLDHEIYTPDERRVFNAMIGRFDPIDRKVFLMHLFALGLTKNQATEDVRRLRNKTLGKIRTKGLIVVQDDGRWVSFDTDFATSLDITPLSLSPDEQDILRKSAERIIQEAIYALYTFENLSQPSPRSSPVRTSIKANDVYDYFQKKSWELPEVAFKSGDPVRILVSLLRWSFYLLWGGDPPKAYDGHRLKGVTKLGINTSNPIRKFVQQGPSKFSIFKNLKNYQTDMEQVFVLAGLAPESAYRLVQAVFFAVWGWDSFEAAQASNDFARQLLCQIRKVAYDRWGKIVPRINIEKEGVRVNKRGISLGHPLRKLLEHGLKAFYVQNAAALTLKDFQGDLVTLLELGGMAKEEAEEMVQRFYYAHWHWDFLPDLGKRNPDERLLDRLRLAAYHLWGGLAPKAVNKGVIQAVSKEGMPVSHPLHLLIQRGLSELREENTSKCLLTDYQKDLVTVLKLDGVSEEVAQKFVREAYFYRFEWETLGEAKKSGDAKRILIAQIREIAYELWGGDPSRSVYGKNIRTICQDGVPGRLSTLRALFAKGNAKLLTVHIGTMTPQKYRARLLQILTLGGLAPADAQKLIDEAYA